MADPWGWMSGDDARRSASQRAAGQRVGAAVNTGTATITPIGPRPAGTKEEIDLWQAQNAVPAPAQPQYPAPAQPQYPTFRAVDYWPGEIRQDSGKWSSDYMPEQIAEIALRRAGIRREQLTDRGWDRIVNSAYNVAIDPSRPNAMQVVENVRLNAVAGLRPGVHIRPMMDVEVHRRNVAEPAAPVLDSGLAAYKEKLDKAENPYETDIYDQRGRIVRALTAKNELSQARQETGLTNKLISKGFWGSGVMEGQLGSLQDQQAIQDAQLQQGIGVKRAEWGALGREWEADKLNRINLVQALQGVSDVNKQRELIEKHGLTANRGLFDEGLKIKKDRAAVDTFGAAIPGLG